ncbi:formin-like protein 18 isoform X2 [Primulina tabacum]|uniref:formin-like protein 18 isoform X2 n=1 Tax=Primulina tabacum TaxID=48773 RepID=UPI003F59C493
MALFRKLFYRKPPDGLLEICEKVYVFDDCFTTNTWEEQNYKKYVGGIMTQLRENYPDASILVFNFREGETQSQMANALSEYDMTIMEYPRQYEGCPLLPMEMIHHFIRSSESWLSLGLQNLLLTHCEIGGWPVLAFMLAALLIYKKLYSGEHKTLDMVYKQAPRELLHYLSPLNPIPSQLRYLQYVSRRNIAAEWPPLDRALTMDCVIIRMIPNFDGEGGCRPIFRLYGQDPFLVSDRTPKVLFSTPKKSRVVRHYKQAECELIKLDINCHIQGDVVLECINLHDGMEREEMMFRVMFNTAFIRSNILILNRAEIDILWDAKDRFPRDFRAEVIFSEMDAAASTVPLEFSCFEEKDGLPLEAFAKVQEMFSSVDWLVPKGDAAVEVLQNLSLSNAVIEAYSHSEKSPENHHPAMQEYSAESPTNLTSDKQSNFSPQVSSNIDVLKQADPQASKIEAVIFTKPTPVPPGEPTPLTSTVKTLHLLHAKQLGSDARVIDIARAGPCLTETEIMSSNTFFSTSPIPPTNDLVVGPGQSRVSPTPPPPPLTPSLEDRINVRSGVGPPLWSPEMPSVSTPLSKDDTTVTAEDMAKVSRAVSLPPPPPRSPNHSSSTEDAVICDRVVSTPPFSHSFVPNNIQRTKTEPPPPPPSPPLSCTWTTYVTFKIASHISAPLKEDSVFISGHHHSDDPSMDHSSSGFEPLSLSPLSITPPLMNNLATKPPLCPPPPPPLVPSNEILFDRGGRPPIHPPRIPVPISTLKEHLGSLVAPPTPTPPPPQPPPPPPLTTPMMDGSATRRVPVPPPPPPLPPPPISPMKEHLGSVVAPPTPPRPPPPLASPMMDGLAKRSTPCPPPPPPPPITPGESSSIRGDPPPPSPPFHFGQGPSSMPPPPPPPVPALSAKDGRIPTLHAHSIPSVPPPPLNSYKEASNVTTMATRASSFPGSPSPPPPSITPPAVKGKSLLSRTLTSRNNQTKKLKPLHWLKLSRAVSGSLWAETQKSGEASKAPEIDISELESLFSAAIPNPDQGHSGRKLSSRGSMANKSEKVQLIDHRRAYNCEIVLSKVKIPLHDLLSSVLSLEDSALDVDQVDNLIKFCPTKEEMQILKGYTGDKGSLGKCEQFFLALMQVPRIESKLRVFSFKIQFSSQVSDLRNNLNVVNSASDQIRGSSKLKRIMQTILSLGNALNQGTARGSAIGFRLDSLLKLTETRARNNKMTLMHYLCKVLADKLPELLDFWQDLSSLERASKLQLKFLAEEMQAISKGLEKVVQELSMSENDGPASDNFRKALKEFLSFSEGEVRSLASLYSGVGRNVDALILYFGEDPSRCPFEQVISTLLNFVRMFKKSNEENCKQLEFERKKAEKEASAEKSKINATEKDIGNLILSRVKSVK